MTFIVEVNPAAFVAGCILMFISFSMLAYAFRR